MFVLSMCFVFVLWPFGFNVIFHRRMSIRYVSRVHLSVLRLDARMRVAMSLHPDQFCKDSAAWKCLL